VAARIAVQKEHERELARLRGDEEKSVREQIEAAVRQRYYAKWWRFDEAVGAMMPATSTKLITDE
jgi:hypothetical protein